MERHSISSREIRKILVVGAGPIALNSLRIDEEARSIQEGIRRSKYRESFVVEVVLAARLGDFRKSVLEHRPAIVHFCGHGRGDGSLLFEDDFRGLKGVSVNRLKALFLLLVKDIQCVVLSACYSSLLAEILSQHAAHAVGVPGRVRDFDALEYARGFYDALGAGFSFVDAHESGCLSVECGSLDGHRLPVIFSHPEAPSGAMGRYGLTKRVQRFEVSSGCEEYLSGLVSNGNTLPVLDANGERIGGVAIHLGSSLVVGRQAGLIQAYGASERLSMPGVVRVHWGSSLGGLMLSQVVARYAFSWHREGCSLSVENLTDYSLRAKPFLVRTSCSDEVLLLPGACLESVLKSKGEMVIFLGENSSFELTGVCFEVVPDRAVGIPVLISRRGFKSEALSESSGALEDMGVWIPLSMAQLEGYLMLLGRPIEIFVPAFGVWVLVFFDPCEEELMVRAVCM